jgi:RND family efflux transporter MFP subunit
MVEASNFMNNYAKIAGFLVISALGLTGCSRNKGAELKGPPPVPVTAYEVKAGNAVYYDVYPATVTALNQVEIRPEVSGYIKAIYFKDGQHLRKGEKLYEIDQQPFRAAYDQALANLNVARANLAKAQDDADRYRDLAEHDAVARQTLDHAMADLRAAKMQVAAAQANVKNVQTNLRYSVIYAPFDCTIGISQVKLGSSVTAGQTLLNTVSSINPIAVDCAVDEKLIDRFTDLLQRKPNDPDSTFSIVLPDESVYTYPGHLSVIDRSVDPQTGTIRIRVIFPNPRNVLRAGLTCDLRVRTTSGTTSVLIPYKAVTEQMGEYFVFVIHGNKVSQQRVILGMTIRDMVVVKEGLTPGEQIVTEGIQRLRDNSTIALTPAGLSRESLGQK